MSASNSVHLKSSFPREQGLALFVFFLFWVDLPLFLYWQLGEMRLAHSLAQCS